MLNQERIFRLIRFCAVGTTVAAIDFGGAWGLNHWLQPLIAVSIAYFIAASCHFLLNKMWVFRCSRTDYARQVSQYLLALGTSWLTTVVIVKFALSTITHNILIAKLFAVPPATSVAFFLMQFLVFHKRQRPASVCEFGE